MPSDRKHKQRKGEAAADPGASDKQPRDIHMGLGARLRAYFLAGVLITAPISITLYLAWTVVSFIDSKVTPLIPAKYNPENYLPFAVPGLGLVILIVLLILIGALTAGYVGRMVTRIYEGVLSRTPVVRNVYGAIKQIIETVLAQQSPAFSQAVLVEYPRRGLWAIAFITGRTEGEVQNITDEELINVFLPTTPNPTSGFLLFVPRRDIMPLSMTVEEAAKMVISGGIVTPPDRRPPEVQATPPVTVAGRDDIDIKRLHQRRPPPSDLNKI
ncbi:MAG: DUF502 domain-containing protein [Rhodospirillales bacterium]|nr:DUF502 domain-containing protein [Rhodospirillales bacterium]